MKKVLIIASLFVGVHQILMAQKLAQKSLITVLGTDKYLEYAVGRVMMVRFIEDPTKCDPLKGNMSLEEQINYFSKELTNANITFSNFKQMELDIRQKFRHKNFTYLTKSSDEYNVIQAICASLSINIVESYYQMPESRFEDEDNRAIGALKDATRKAQFIAKKLGAKKITVLKIDDDTTTDEINTLMDMYGNEDNKEEFIDMLTMFADMDSSSGMKNQQGVNKKEYHLLVTFQVE